MTESQRKAQPCLPVDIRQITRQHITSISRSSRYTGVSSALCEADNLSATLVGRIEKLTFEICLLKHGHFHSWITEICVSHGLKSIICERARKESSLLSFSVNGRS